MSYTGNPSTNPVDALRLEIGDTDEDNSILTDNDYIYFINKNPDSFRKQWQAAAQAALFKLARYTRERAGQIEVDGSAAYRQYAQALKDKITNPAYSDVHPISFFGGVDRANYISNSLNPDIVDQQFFRGQSNNFVHGFGKRDIEPNGVPVEPIEQDFNGAI